MAKIGRKIAYDIVAGNILVDTGEMQGDVVEVPVERMIEVYPALFERNRNTFDVLELSYGAHAQNFAECTGYRVNVETKELEFSYPDPNNPDAPQVFVKPLTEQIEELKIQNILLEAQTQANADRADFHEDLITELAMLLYQ